MSDQKCQRISFQIENAIIRLTNIAKTAEKYDLTDVNGDTSLNINVAIQKVESIVAVKIGHAILRQAENDIKEEIR